MNEFQELNRSLAEFFDLLNRQPRVGVSQIAELAQLNVLIRKYPDHAREILRARDDTGTYSDQGE